MPRLDAADARLDAADARVELAEDNQWEISASLRGPFTENLSGGIAPCAGIAARDEILDHLMRRNDALVGAHFSIGAEEKRSVSHRGRALEAFVAWLDSADAARVLRPINDEE